METRKVFNAERKALQVMGLGPEATLEVVKAKYKALVKQHHPDANGGDRSTEDRLIEIIKAYNYLKTVVRGATSAASSAERPIVCLDRHGATVSWMDDSGHGSARDALLAAAALARLDHAAASCGGSPRSQARRSARRRAPAGIQ